MADPVSLTLLVCDAIHITEFIYKLAKRSIHARKIRRDINERTQHLLQELERFNADLQRWTFDRAALDELLIANSALRRALESCLTDLEGNVIRFVLFSESRLEERAREIDEAGRQCAQTLERASFKSLQQLVANVAGERFQSLLLFLAEQDSIELLPGQPNIGVGVFNGRPVTYQRLCSENEQERMNSLLSGLLVLKRLSGFTFIQSFFGVVREDGSVYAIVEDSPDPRVPWRQLTYVLENIAVDKLPTSVIFSIAYNIASTVQYIHRHDVIHKAICCDNILITHDFDKSPRFKLAGFNESRNIYGGSSAPPSLHPRFEAPEALTDGKHSVQTDIYSLGVVLWQLEYKRTPFKEEKSNHKERFAELHSSIGFPPDNDEFPLGKEYDQIVRGCCAKIPTERLPMSEIVRRLGILRVGK